MEEIHEALLGPLPRMSWICVYQPCPIVGYSSSNFVASLLFSAKYPVMMHAFLHEQNLNISSSTFPLFPLPFPLPSSFIPSYQRSNYSTDNFPIASLALFPTSPVVASAASFPSSAWVSEPFAPPGYLLPLSFLTFCFFSLGASAG